MGAPAERQGGRGRLALILAPIVVVTIAAYAGDALTTTWADQHPLWLMLLNARNRILVLTTNNVDAVTFYVAGTFRLMLTDPLYYLVGVLYGEGALAWAKNKSAGASKFLTFLERHFDKAAWAFIIVMPNPLISLLAGRMRMKLWLFFGLNVFGTVGRLYLIRWLGESFAGPIDDVLAFFARNRLVLFLVSVGFIVVMVGVQRLRGGGELADLRSLEDALEPEAE